MNDKPTLTKPKLPPFWLTWLGGFLAVLPVYLSKRVLFPSVDPTVNVPDALREAFAFSLSLSLLPYIVPYLNKADEETLRKQEQARIAELKKSPKLSWYHWYGLICAFAGTLSCVSHVVSGQPSVLGVVGFTIGVPFYYFLLVRLQTMLWKGVERRTARKKAVADALAAALAPLDVRTELNVEPQAVLPAAQAREVQTLGRNH